MRVTIEILRVKGLDCCGKLAPPYQPRNVLFSYNLIVLKQCTVLTFRTHRHLVTGVKDYSGFCVTTLGQIALQMLTASNHISSPFFSVKELLFHPCKEL